VPRKKGSASKGSVYERGFCEQLSLWWSDGVDDALFWRSQGSGGRATGRTKVGKETHGQYGDVAATHRAGEKLIDILTIELKRGYTKDTIHDTLDRTDANAQQGFEAFIHQAIRSHEEAGSLFWFLVTRRDRRTDFCWFPHSMMKELMGVGAFPNKPQPRVLADIYIRTKGRTDGQWVAVFGLPLTDFFAQVQPSHIKKLE
jgi:hypothetical protein